MRKNAKRDVAQLVECASGGREVAGSSPVIPTYEAQMSDILALVFRFFSSFVFNSAKKPDLIQKLKLKPLK